MRRAERTSLAGMALMVALSVLASPTALASATVDGWPVDNELAIELLLLMPELAVGDEAPGALGGCAFDTVDGSTLSPEDFGVYRGNVPARVTNGASRTHNPRSPRLP